MDIEFANYDVVLHQFNHSIVGILTGAVEYAYCNFADE